MTFDEAKKIFNSLFNNIDGYSLAGLARMKLHYTDRTLTYGEIDFDSFYQILKQVNPQKKEIFYDLGSGSGKAVIAASLLFDFHKSVGIEILDELYQVSKKISINLKKQNHNIDIIQDNYLSYDFSEADIIFAHCTCMHQELIIPLEAQFQKLKKGSRIITVTKTLTSQNFLLIKTQEYKMGWGRASVNFYDKIR